MRRFTSVLAIALALVGGSAILGLLSRAGDRPVVETASQGQPRTEDGPIERSQIEYPQAAVHQAATMADGLFPEDPIRFQDDATSPILLARKDDQIRAFAAYHSKMTGGPYDPRDEFVPLYREDGTLAGYTTRAVPRTLTLSEVRESTFDICALRDASNLEAAEHLARTRGLSLAALPQALPNC